MKTENTITPPTGEAERQKRMDAMKSAAERTKQLLAELDQMRNTAEGQDSTERTMRKS